MKFAGSYIAEGWEGWEMVKMWTFGGDCASSYVAKFSVAWAAFGISFGGCCRCRCD